MSIAVIILAAGKGTRMKSNLPKVLHEIAGAPMLHHTLRTAQALSPEHMIVIAGHCADLVEASAKACVPDCKVVVQPQQNGTGDAVGCAKDALNGFQGTVVVLYADSPLITAQTLKTLITAAQNNAAAVLGFHTPNPAKYGRLVMNGDQLEHITEFKEATAKEIEITFCNSGFMAASADVLFDLLSQVDNKNEAGECYLTDVIGLARSKGLRCTAVACDMDETIGVNSQRELAAADGIFQTRMRGDLLDMGVSIPAPKTVYFSYDTQIGAGASIEPNVVFGAGVAVEGGAKIRAFSHLEHCYVAAGSTIGPYARLRPGAHIGADAKIGNFVEIKSAQIDAGAKVNHLSYIGDAEIGPRANIGAGTITCNFDGVFKHKTTIGADAFVGSNTLFIAPVAMGENAMTGSGTVVTSDIPKDALAIARTKQQNKIGMAAKLMARLKALKNKGS